MIQITPLLSQIANEWRIQRRRPFEWFCLSAYFLLAIGDTVQAGWSAEGGVLINGADQIATRSIIYSLLGVLVAAGLVSEPFSRDRASSSAGAVLTTGAGRGSLALGRFVVAATLVVTSGLLFIPGVVIGALAPGIAPEFVGPLVPSHFAAAALVFIIPNFLLFSATAFAVSSRTQSQGAAYGAAIALLSVWVTVRMLLGQDVLRHDVFGVAAIVDPFGSIASAEFAMARTVAENNAMFPPLAGLLLVNRLVWLAVTVVLVVLGTLGFPMRESLPRGKQPREKARRGGGASVSPGWLGPLGTMIVWEIRTIRRTPGALLVLVLLAFSLWWSAASAVTHRFSLPSTDLLVHNTGFYFDKILVLSIVWLSGDLIWRERSHRIDQLLDSLPSRDWHRFLSKLAALICVVAVFWLVSIVVGVLYQAATGYFDFELDLYIIDSFVIKAPYYAFFAVLALTTQVLIGRRYIAMGVVMLVYFSEVMLDALGLHHPVYRFGRSSFFWYSLMDGYGHFLTSHLWLLLYWTLGAAILAVLGGLAFSRGHEQTPGYRLLPARLRFRAGIALLVVAFAFAGVGAHIWWQSAVRAEWPRINADAKKADVERAYGGAWRDVPQPRVVEIDAELDLYPSERRFELHGSFVLHNPHNVSIDRVLVLAEPWLSLDSLAIEGGVVGRTDTVLNARILELSQPHLPGTERLLSFSTSWAPPEGFAVHAKNDGVPMVSPTEVLGNGTSLLNIQLMPAVGYTDRVEHKPAWKRRKFGLDPSWSPPDPSIGLSQAHATFHLDWVRHLDMTITTDADQSVYHPGRLVDRWKDDTGRQGFRYVLDHPSRGWATLVSGRFVESRFHRPGVPDVVMAHDPNHTHALEPFANALLDAIEHFQNRYGPPPFAEFRMAEQSLHFDGMGVRSGMGFASEVLGWKTDVRASGGEDLHAMAAHMMGMTWFGDQIIPANVAGAKVVHAGLPFWSAQLYLHQRRDRELDRTLRMQELGEAFRSRSSLIDEEAPFIEEFKDSTMLRAKGGNQMLYLADLMGGPAELERVFASFLDSWRYRPAPFPTANDFVEHLSASISPELHGQIESIFRHITTWSLGVTEATRTRTESGLWRVTATFEARQLRTIGWGTTMPVPIDANVSLVVFRDDGFDEDSVILEERLIPEEESFTMEWLLDEKPTRIGIDPLLLLPDPNPRDNVRTLTGP
ncbi:MAG: hypothetical protein AAF937_01405 [Planctomycetota bacterium]